MRNIIVIFLVYILYGCKKESIEVATSGSTERSPNILLIIADDLGKDAINGFSEGVTKPNTPNIDELRNSGLSFSNFWTYPTCSPTRASILTGTYGYRTGVMWAGDELSVSETSIHQYIKQNTNNKYSTALVGKWHLSGNNVTFNPEIYGIDYFSGLIRGEVQNYYNWLLTEDGDVRMITEYITTKFTDLAIDWIEEQEKPWFMWLAYNAPHTPFHVPPSTMHNQGDLPEFTNEQDELPYYMAAIEAMDYQIGKLLNTMSEEVRENTIIIFIGDNGTPVEVVQSPYLSTTAKGTLYQGGVNVPMFVSGKGVLRTGIDDNLIVSTDLFSTISEIAGVTVNEINDSKSFMPLLKEKVSNARVFQYTEKDNGTVSNWAISNGYYKLIEFNNGNQELYDLKNDSYEELNIVDKILNSDQETMKLELEEELKKIRQ